MLPELQCTDDEGNLIEYAKNPELPQVMIPPTTRKDPVYNMLRTYFNFGFESPLEILESFDIQSNKAVLMFLSSLEKQGNTMKVGPAAVEMQQRCAVRFNVFLSEKGDAILENAFIPVDQIPERPPPCVADEVSPFFSKKDVSNRLLKGPKSQF